MNWSNLCKRRTRNKNKKLCNSHIYLIGMQVIRMVENWFDHANITLAMFYCSYKCCCHVVSSNVFWKKSIRKVLKYFSSWDSFVLAVICLLLTVNWRHINAGLNFGRMNLAKEWIISWRWLVKSRSNLNANISDTGAWSVRGGRIVLQLEHVENHGKKTKKLNEQNDDTGREWVAVFVFHNVVFHPWNSRDNLYCIRCERYRHQDDEHFHFCVIALIKKYAMLAVWFNRESKLKSLPFWFPFCTRWLQWRVRVACRCRRRWQSPLSSESIRCIREHSDSDVADQCSSMFYIWLHCWLS